MKRVVASGYFNPLHIGHVRYLQDAKKLGDFLIVIVNNDDQVVVKGSKPFMPEWERVEIIKALGCVDDVVLSIDKDKTVCKTLEALTPDIFAKGGDSTIGNIPEMLVCKSMGTSVILGVGGDKIQASSKLLENI